MNNKTLIWTASALLISAAAGVSVYFFRPVTLYKPDDETVQVMHYKSVQMLSDGWYEEPVHTMYAPDGRTICVYEREISEYENVGWYREVPLLMYAPDGRTIYINTSEQEAYENVGWYTEPVTLLYADDGRTMYFKNSEVAAQLEAGWYDKRPEKEGLKELRDEIVSYLSSRAGDWGVFAQNLATNEYLSINEKQYSSASLIKLFTMASVYNELECGSFEKSETVTELLRQMITESSNSACNALTKRVGGGSTVNGFDTENRIIKSLGCTNTTHGSELVEVNGQRVIFTGFNRTSPRDCGRILKDIYNGELVTKEASDEMLELLKAQTRTWKIPASLPEGTVTANKTGETDTVQADAAIVYSPNADYILCVIGNGSVGAGVDTIQHISKLTYNYFNR